MKLKITVKSLVHAVYLLVVINGVLGMVFKLAPSGLLRKVVIMSKMFVLLSLVCACLINFMKFSKFQITLHLDKILLITFVIYELYISKIRGLLIFPEAYLDILIWPLIYLLFRNCTIKHDVSKELRNLTEVAMIAVLLLSVPLIIKYRIGEGDGGGVIFYVYYCITFLPMALCVIEEDKIKNRLFLFSILILALSAKRSGTIVAVIGYIVYLFTNVSVRNDIKNKFVRYWKYILAILAFFILIVALDQLFSFSIISRLKSIGSDRGSGREAIWIEIFEAFSESQLNVKLFGHGYQAVYYRLKPYGVDRLAHNSFIEFLYDYGYVGLGIFLSFFVTQIIGGLKASIKKNPHAPEMLYSLLVALVFGMSSYFFEESAIIIPIAAFWGCFAGLNSRKTHIEALRE